MVSSHKDLIREKHENEIRNEIRIKEHTLVSLLKTCTNKKDLYKGIRLHGEIVKEKWFEKSPYIATTLVNMYAKCGMIEKAEKVLEELSTKNVATWTSLISGYANHGKGLQALKCYKRMQNEGILPNALTFTCILKACANIGDIKKGKQIHEEVFNRGMLSEKDVLLGTSLVDMYAKCGDLGLAQRVLEEIPVRNLASWSALMRGYAEHKQNDKALNSLECMQNEGFSPDAITFTCILKACGNSGAIEKGQEIHDEILSQGLLNNNIVLGTALVDMYAKCDMPTKAEYVFKELGLRDIVTWSALIAGYAQQGQSYEALRCFKEMQSEGLSPNTVTFICILKACGINEGKQIHEEIVSSGLLLGGDIVLTNALLDMYVRCGYLSNAYEVLEELPCRNVVSWNTLIGGYAKYGLCEDAINCLGYMQNEGISPNAVTFIGILKACCNIGALHMGENMHKEIAHMGLLQKDIVLGTTLVDMYAKCGALAKSQEVLEELPDRDVVSWSALIAGYAEEGQVQKALCCLECMRNEGFTPNEVTFLCILSACGHSGLIDQAQMLFQNMEKEYGMIPSSEHHISMIVVYGNAGHFDNAMSVIKVMPSLEYGEIWLVLLGACRKWGNVKLGILAFDQAIQQDSTCPAAYTLMATIFTDSGMQKDAQRVIAMRLKYACLNNRGNCVVE